MSNQNRQGNSLLTTIRSMGLRFKRALRMCRGGIGNFLVAILIVQLAFPPICYAPDPSAPGSLPSINGKKPEPLTPYLAQLMKEVQSGSVRSADPTLITDQYLRIYDRPGIFTRFARRVRGRTVPASREFSLNDLRVDRQPVILNNFEKEVEINYDPNTGELIFALGSHTNSGQFVATMEHVRKNIKLSGTPAVDPEFVALATQHQITLSGGARTIHELRLMPLVEFIGDEKQEIKGHGFYAPIDLYPLFPVLLPKGAEIENLEFFSENSQPRELNTLEGSPVPKLIHAGDLVINVQLVDGTKRSLWVSRETLYQGLENSLKEALLLAAISNPTPETAAAVERVFKGDVAELDEVRQRLEGKVEGNDLLNRALNARFTYSGSAYQIKHVEPMAGALNPGESRPTALTAAARLSRHEIDTPYSETGTWSAHHRLLEEAKERDPHRAISSTVKSQAAYLVPAALAADRKNIPRHSFFRRALQKTKSLVQSPIRAMALAAVLAGGVYAVNPDAGWVNGLTAFGSRVYEYSSQEGFFPTVVRTLSSPEKNMTEFLAKTYMAEGGLNTIGSWVGTLSFYLALLPLTYLANYGYQRIRGRKVEFSVGGLTSSLLTELGNAFAWINRPLQEAVWNSPLLRQYNLYPAILAGRDPFATSAAWNAPWASSATIESNRDRLNAQQNREKELKAATSRLVALAIISKRSGIDLATLDLAMEQTKMSEFLRQILFDPGAAHTWVETTTRLYQMLDGILELDEVPLDRQALVAFTEKYQAKATELLAEINSRPTLTAMTIPLHGRVKDLVYQLGNGAGQASDSPERQTKLKLLASQAREALRTGQEVPAALVALANRFDPFFKNPTELATVDLTTWAEGTHKALDTALFATLPAEKKRGMLTQVAYNTWRFFNDNVLQLLAFGKPGLEAHYAFRGREVSASAARVTTMMAAADYPLTALIMASQTPQDWLWNFPPGKARIFAAEAEQAVSWNMGPQFDAMANEVAAARANPYAPLQTFYFDPQSGGVSRQQSLEEGLVAILQGQTNPNPNGPSILNSWSNALTNIFRFLQAKIILAGVPMALGMGMTAMAKGEYQAFLGAPAWLAVPIIAGFTSLWYITIKSSVAITPEGTPAPGYATIWGVVNTFMNHTSGAATANENAVKNAVALLSSSDPAKYRQGAIQAKALFARGRAYLDPELNKPSKDYSKSDAEQMVRLLAMPGKLPLSTIPGSLLDLVMINILLGALGSTVMYDTLNKTLFAEGANAVLEAAKSIGWFGATFASVYGIAAFLNHVVRPRLGPLHRGIEWTADIAHGANAAVGQACSSIMSGGSVPLLRTPINPH